MVQDRLLAQLSIAFGAVAMLLAALGLYGVLSYGLTRRTSEIGIRKALGAQQGTLVAMVARDTGLVLVLGLFAGAVVSVAAVRLITSRLYGLSPADPLTMTVAVAGLTVVAAVATALPAYRASRVDPLVALRHE
jgi:ABC-type antimicrobial peptide transport system permease subunit